MEVGNAIAVYELQGGVLPEEIYHLRCGVQKSQGPCLVKLRTQLMTQVGKRRGKVFHNTGFGGHGVAR